MLALNLGVNIDSQNNQDQLGPGKPPNIHQLSCGLPGAVGYLGAVGRPGPVVPPPPPPSSRAVVRLGAVGPEHLVPLEKLSPPLPPSSCSSWSSWTRAFGSPGKVGTLQVYYFSHSGGHSEDSHVPTISTSPPQNCRPTFVCENINPTKRGIFSYINISYFKLHDRGRWLTPVAEN